MARIFVIADSYSAANFLLDAEYLLNDAEDANELIFLRENHVDEGQITSHRVIQYEKAEEALENCDIAIIYDSDAIPEKTKELLLQFSNYKRIIEFPDFSKTNTDNSDSLLKLIPIAHNHPLIVIVSLGLHPQIMHTELLINSILGKHKLTVNQLFTSSTDSLLRILKRDSLIKEEILGIGQQNETPDTVVVTCSIGPSETVYDSSLLKLRGEIDCLILQADLEDLKMARWYKKEIENCLDTKVDLVIYSEYITIDNLLCRRKKQHSSQEDTAYAEDVELENLLNRIITEKISLPETVEVLI